MRTAANREVSDGYLPRTELEAIAGGGGGIGADAQEALADIRDTVASIDDRVHTLEAKSDAAPEEIRELAMGIVDYLPRLAEQGAPNTAYVTGQQSFSLQDSKFPTQIEALADLANRKEPREEDKEWSKAEVREALEQAVKGFARVEKTRVGGETRFYEIDPDDPTEEPK
jgi:NAD(P)-dependent dehydrogenase (short-subunit alcohol dehydrogenase family)